MRYLMMVLALIVLMCQGSMVFAGKGGHQGPSERAYERANEHASFKRDSGWTQGQHEKKDKKCDEKKCKNKKHKHKHKERHHDDDLDKKDEHQSSRHEHEDADHHDDTTQNETMNQTK